MAVIRHYTKPYWIKSIIDDGVINLEGYNDKETMSDAIYDFYGYRPNMSGIERGPEWDKMCSAMKGDQVWLTEQRRCNTASKNFIRDWKDCYFEFDTADIPVRRWHHYKKDILKNKPEAQRFITALDKTAKDMGDDSYNYWVSDVPIDISLAKRTGILSDEFSLEDIMKASKMPQF